MKNLIQMPLSIKMITTSADTDAKRRYNEMSYLKTFMSLSGSDKLLGVRDLGTGFSDGYPYDYLAEVVVDNNRLFDYLNGYKGIMDKFKNVVEQDEFDFSRYETLTDYLLYAARATAGKPISDYLHLEGINTLMVSVNSGVIYCMEVKFEWTDGLGRIASYNVLVDEKADFEYNHEKEMYEVKDYGNCKIQKVVLIGNENK